MSGWIPRRDTGLRHRLGQRGEVLVLGIRVQGQGGASAARICCWTNWCGLFRLPGEWSLFRSLECGPVTNLWRLHGQRRSQEITREGDSSEETGSLIYLSKNVFRRFNSKTLMVAKGLDREKVVLLLRLMWCAVRKMRNILFPGRDSTPSPETPR